MKYQTLFSWENKKKKKVKMSSAENFPSMLNVKCILGKSYISTRFDGLLIVLITNCKNNKNNNK